MARNCEVPDCIYDVWGTDKNTGIGYCYNHQWKRTDKKKSPSKFKEKPQKHIPDFGFDNQQDMFAWLWDNAKDANGIVTCPFTKERLNRFYGTDMWYSCFAHVLPKGRYTYWKLNPDNLRIVFPLFHSCVDSKPLSARKEHPLWKFDLWDKEVIDLKLQYQDFKNKNLLS